MAQKEFRCLCPHARDSTRSLLRALRWRRSTECTFLTETSKQIGR